MDIIEFAEKSGVRLWPVQRVVLKLFYGLQLDDQDEFDAPQLSLHPDAAAVAYLDRFRFTEKTYAEFLLQRARLSPSRNARRLVLVGGRRIGKSMILKLIAAFEAYTALHSSIWKGRKVTGVASDHVGIISYTRDSASAILSESVNLCFSSGLFPTPEFTNRGLIEWKGEESRSRLGIHTGLARSVRGHCFRAALLDELSAFPKASVEELAGCVKPGIDAERGKMIVVSTPVVDDEALWKSYTEGFADPETMVVRIPTWEVTECGFSLSSVSGLPLNTFLCEYGAEFFVSKKIVVPRVQSSLFPSVELTMP